MNLSYTKLSIITICLNDKQGLEKTILSATKQSFRDFEHIVIDGGSIDGSLEVIERYKDKLAYFVSEKDSGRYNAMNKGILNSTGQFCLFLNSGDYLSSDDILRNIFTKEYTGDILYGDLLIERNDRRETYRQPPEIDLRYLMNATISHPASFIKKELLSKYGLYDESFIIAGDYELLLRLVIKNKVKTQYIPLTISVFNTNGISSDEKFNNIQIEERKKAQANNIEKIFLDYYLSSEILLSEYVYNNFITLMSNRLKNIPILNFMQKVIYKILKNVIKFKHNEPVVFNLK